MVKFSKYWSPTVRGNKRVKFQGNNYQGAPEVNSGTFLKKIVMKNFFKFLFFSFFLFPFFLFYLQFQNTKPNPRGQGLRVRSQGSGVRGQGLGSRVRVKGQGPLLRIRSKSHRGSHFPHDGIAQCTAVLISVAGSGVSYNIILCRQQCVQGRFGEARSRCCARTEGLCTCRCTPC